MDQHFDPYHRWLGIPPEDQPPDHYRLLGLQRFEDVPEVIETAADRQMSHLRTYQTGSRSDLSQKLLNEVAAAKITLLNADKKSAYDAALRRQEQSEQPRSASTGTAAPPASDWRLVNPLSPQPRTSGHGAANRKKWAIALAAVVLLPIVAAMTVRVASREKEGLAKRQTSPVLANSPERPIEERSIETGSAVAKAEHPPETVLETGSQNPAPPPATPGPEASVSRAAPSASDRSAGRQTSTEPAAPKPVSDSLDSPVSGARFTKDFIGALPSERFAEVETSGGAGFAGLAEGAEMFPGIDKRWNKIPDWLRGTVFYQHSSLQSTHIDRGETQFRVRKGGVVLLAVTSRWGGGGSRSGGWLEKVIDRDAFIAQGWQEVGRIGCTMKGKDPGHDWLVYARFCGEGESFRLRTEKYFGPILILRHGQAGTSMASKPDEKPSQPGRTRLAVPSGAEQEEWLAQIERVSNGTDAKDPSQQLDLARRLLELSRQTSRPAEEYALLRGAMRLAGEAGGAELMLQIADRLSQRFEVDPAETREEALREMAKSATSNAALESLVTQSSTVIGRAIAEDRLPDAVELIDAVYVACLRPQGKELRKRVHDRRVAIQDLHSLWLNFQQARQTLAASPDDPEANLAAGRWYAFQRRDWKAALPHLAKGSDAGLRAAAQRDLAIPAVHEAQVELGDLWWGLAEKAGTEEQAVLRQRAAHWYRLAVEKLDGLPRYRVETRLRKVPAADSTGNR